MRLQAEVESAVAMYFLQPAEAVLCEGPAQIKTVLGSCVGVTMRAPRLGYSAMVHCVLPDAGMGRRVPANQAMRYVDTAIARLMAAFEQHGARPGELEVKLFGGADGLSGEIPGGGYEVGRRNVEAAQREFAARGLTPLAECVGGRSGRVIEFNTASGEVTVRTLDTPVEKRPRSRRRARR